jgi:phenylalanyl-tRNA synthetase beta chain
VYVPSPSMGAASTRAASLEQSIREHGAPLVTDATLFDVYQGKGIPEGRKSLAFRVLLQDTEKTLTDSEVEAVVQRIIAILVQKHGAALRI